MPFDPSLPFSRFGTAPESPTDERDHLITAYLRPMSMSLLPDEVGMANVDAHRLIGITDQEQEGACTGHAWRNTKTTQEIRSRRTRWAKKRVPVHGPRGMYVLAKQIGGYPEEEGAYMRDVCKAAAQFGTPREKDWPYVAHTSNGGQHQDVGGPSLRWLQYAKPWGIGAYARVRTIEQILTVLHTTGPVFMAMSLTDSFFNTGSDGIVPQPSGEDVGGHAMSIIAAVQSTRKLYVANSWGLWGQDGYCWIDFDHFMDKAASEAWSIPDA